MLDLEGSNNTIMRILITGFRGGVGNEIFKNLSYNNKNQIFLIGKNDIATKKNNITFIKQDLTKKFIFKLNIDLVIHCANNHYHTKSIKNKKFLYDENIKMTQNLIKFCNKNKIKKVIFLSSIDVYGRVNYRRKILKENQKLKPHNWYAKSKLLSERLFLDKKTFFVKSLKTLVCFV